MPIGVIVNCLAVLLGGVTGALLGERIPLKLRNVLPLIFGLASIAMGLGAVVQVNTLPAVILALILGSAIGELIDLEGLIARAVGKVKGPMEKLFAKKKPGADIDDSLLKESSGSEFMERFVSIIVLFCASGTGIFGALTEGITGDYTILLTKSILDFFTAIIFASTLGYLVAAVALPQFAVLMLLFISAALIMPLTTPIMLADFTALGGIIMLATGFRISGIKSFPIANMLPAFILVMPLSYLWSLLPI